MPAKNAARWGKMRSETMRLLLDLFGDGQTGRKDYVSWLCGIIRTGDNLADRERADLIKWLIANGYPTKNLGDIFTIQYTHNECAAAIGCDLRQSKRYRDWLVDNGVLITVQPGKKGYPGFFILAPVMVTNSADNVTLKTVTGDNGLGDNAPKIRGHQNSVTSGNAAISRTIQNYPEKKKEQWSCIRCGAHVFDLLGNGQMVACRSCNTAQRVKE